ncbi:hypothetical protein M8C21_007651 [Ambrosia artemisiifolia]|uniref:P-type Ca(2+) transporter n=1 Tax=Ambrosia artemisiifolia TaxID=4212 RepID=A0AAD5GQI7_AMBAR|nr:hypothetical protein M8C21_007651 [Ambrosia artemisiifolia]
MSGSASPYRRHKNDVEFGGEGFEDDYDSPSDPFDIVRTKSASVHSLRRWRQAALVLNASRRFRYTLDLKKEEEKKQIIAKIRTHAQVIRAAYLFQAAGAKPNGAEKAPPSPTPTGDYSISPDQLASMTRDHDSSALQNYGGVKGLSEKLKTNPDKGIHDDESSILDRKNVFGSNTYPRKKGRSFWRFVLDACRDTTLIILMGIKEGWYDGGSIAMAVIIVIVVTAVSDYKQSLQFQNLNEEKQNIHLEVVRGGRRVEISIFDIVVGDVIPLKIGDQVHKDHKAPFLMSGCKVADGYGTMLVTSVGINTEWGLLMASISEDNGEETPLQVRLNGVATFIGIVGLAVAILVLVVLLIRYFTGNTKDTDETARFIAGKTSLGDAVDGAIKIFTVAMTVVEAYIFGKKIDPPDNKSELPSGLMALLIEGIAQNTTGSVFLPEGGGNVEVSGSPTEKAILQWGFNLGMNFDVSDSEVHIHWKGAAEIVLAACTSYMDTNETLVPLDNDKVEYFKKAIETMAAGSLRCVAIAYRTMKGETFPVTEEELEYWQMPEDDLVLLAIVGIKDPCRPNVRDAVELCKKAGVKVRMVTGDNLQTAKAIALECGILESNADAKEPNLIEGKTFRGLSEDQRLEVADKISVMGRSSPNDKLLLVQALRKNGHVVAVTGDGTNDAPALHELLWVNLIMDTLGALALATEPPTDHLMDRTPVGRREPLITNIMWRNLLVQAMYQVTVLLVLNFDGKKILNLEHESDKQALKKKNTLIFNAFVFSQIFNEFNARKPDEMNVFKGVTKNRLFMGIVGFTIVLQVIIIMFLGKFTTTVRLSWQFWLISIGIGLVSWPLAVLGKLIPVSERPFSEYFYNMYKSCKPSRLGRNRGSSRANVDDT